MNKPEERPRRSANNDLSELVRILGKLEFEDFMSLFKIFENYRDKTSSLRIIRLLYDSLSLGRFNQVKAMALPLAAKALRAQYMVADAEKSAKPVTDKLSTTRFKNGVTPARLLKRRRSLGPMSDKDETDILDSGLTERMRHKT